MKKEIMSRKFYCSSNSLEDFPNKVSNLEEAIVKAQEEMAKRGLNKIGIVQVVAIVRKALPKPVSLVDVFIVD